VLIKGYAQEPRCVTMEIFPVPPKSPSEMYAIPRNEPACSFALSLTASFPARCNYRVSQSEDQRCRFLGSHCSRGAPIVFRARAHTRSSRSSFSIIRIISSGFVPRVHSNSIELSLKSSASHLSFSSPPSLSFWPYYFIFSPLTFRERHRLSESIHMTRSDSNI